MDPEHGYGAGYTASSRRGSVQRRLDVPTSHNSAHSSTAASSVGRAILGFLFVLLVLGVLPASFVFWACLIVLVFTCLRLRVQAQTLQRALEQEDLARSDSSGALNLLELGRALGPGGPVVRIIPGGGGLLLLRTEPRLALEQLDLQLRQLEEEAGSADDLASFARHGLPAAAFSPVGATPPPVSDADIASLPCWPYKPPRANTAATADGVGPDTQPSPHGRVGTAPASLPTPPAGSSQAVEHLPTASPALLPTSPSLSASTGGSGGGQPQGVQQGCLAPSRSGAPTTGVTAAPAAAMPVAAPGSPAAATGAVATGAAGRPRASATEGCSDPDRCPPGPALRSAAPPSAPLHEHHGLVCPVCLDAVEEDAIVMTLPCLHQFHAVCVTPWLRQQGVYASCPMCKTPVFR